MPQQQRRVAEQLELEENRVGRCCVPGECLLPQQPIRLDRLGEEELVKVVCNDDHCTQGQFMHQPCFDAWEQQVLQFLRSCGRARSWSAKQRLQNLWTKKGYDLAFRACGCRCGRGHLKKDLDWTPPRPAPRSVADEPPARPKKKRQRQKQRPPLGRGAGDAVDAAAPDQRHRAGSASSTCSSGSPPSTSSPLAAAKRPAKLMPETPARLVAAQKGLFARRQDFSSFNILPRHKVNSYHIKVDDEEHHGSDEVRALVFATLSSANRSRVCCLVCEGSLPVYDRYPLLDGTFFLSPTQHSQHGCFRVSFEGRIHFMFAVCMGCLEGWRARLQCRACHAPWNGASLVLGTLYFYDIFAATPCCQHRVKCNNCEKPLLQQLDQLAFFSDYSHPLTCSHCRTTEAHFAKPLLETFQRTVLEPIVKRPGQAVQRSAPGGQIAK